MTKIESIIVAHHPNPNQDRALVKTSNFINLPPDTWVVIKDDQPDIDLYTITIEGQEGEIQAHRSENTGSGTLDRTYTIVEK